MADSKLSNLTATTALSAGDLFYVVRDPAGTPVDRKIAVENVAAYTQAVGQTLNAQTGTTYTLVTSDANKIVTLSNASAITLTVGTSLDLATGQRIDLIQTGAGQVTVSAGGATLNGTPGLKLRAQYSAASLICVGTDSYILIGDLSA